jgi:hypothetical protein
MTDKYKKISLIEVVSAVAVVLVIDSFLWTKIFGKENVCCFDSDFDVSDSPLENLNFYFLSF